MMQIIQISALFIITTSCKHHIHISASNWPERGILIQHIMNFVTGITLVTLSVTRWCCSHFLLVCPLPVLDAVDAGGVLILLLLHLLRDCEQVVILFEYQDLLTRMMSNKVWYQRLCYLLGVWLGPYRHQLISVVNLLQTRLGLLC